ncbi:reverse transcriptase domain-containing protein [Tanacetum coccineum]
MNPNNQAPPPLGHIPPHIPPPIPQNHGPPGPNLHNPAPDLRKMEELCQFHGLPIDDANKHLDKFLTITQSMKQNEVTDDALRLYLFLYSLTRHATAWFDRLLKNSIHTFEEMVSKFHSKYFPLSMVTKLRNDISNFRQLPDESLFEAWECYKLSIDRYPNHNMLPVTQIDTFYNGLTWRHRDIINAAAGANQMTKMEKDFNERPQGALPSNTIPNPREDVKVITTRSGMTLARTSIPTPNPSSSSSKEVERDPETTMDQVHISSSESTVRVPSSVVQPAPASKTNEIPERNPHQPPIPYPSSFAKALAQMPKYAKMLKDLLTNKEKLLKLANTPLNENCLAVFLRNLPKKLRDPRKFLIPCDFSELEECIALADLGASINLMPLSVWKMLMLPELVPTFMTLELANRSVAYPTGIAEDVFVQVGKFTFPADFVVVDYDVDPCVPLMLGRPFLKTAHALVDHGDESINKIDILDTTCEDYFHEVLNVQQLIHPLSGSPTPFSEHVVASLSLSLTPFGDSDFLLEETDTFISLDDLIPPGIENGIYDSEGDIIFLEYLLNYDPINDLPPPKELKNDEIKMAKSSIEDPPELEIKDLPPYLKYAFLEGTSKLPVIIAKDLKREEKDQLVKRRVNSKINEVIKAEVIKLLDARLIYPILDSPWVSHVHVIPKKGGMTVVTNDNNELIPTRLVTRWRLGMNYIVFLMDFFVYFQIPIDPRDQEKTTFNCPYGTFAYRRMPFGLCNAPGTFQRCMVAIFHDMIEKSIEVFMDDFSVFGDSFSSCIFNLGKMLKRFKDTNLVLNWEKCHFMVKEGIVLDHKISKSGIEVDHAKVDVIVKLPPHTMVKGIRSFLGHTGFYRRFIQDFSKIARPMTHLLEKETLFVFSKECMESFEILKTKLTEASILVTPD